MKAIHHGYDKIILELIDKGANINEKDNDKRRKKMEEQH